MAYDMKNLFGAIVIIVTLSLLVVVGLIMLDTFGDNVKDSTGVTDEAVTVASGTFTTANNEVTSVQAFFNATGEIVALISAADFNWTEESGVVLLNSSYDDGASGDWLINYTYDKDSTTTDALDDSRGAIGAINSTWLALLITIVILSVILGLIIRSFVMNRD